MRRLGPAIALFLLVLAAPAAAKEVVGVQLCGPGGCVDVRDHGAMQAFHDGGNPVEAPAHPSPWYRALITVGAEDVTDTFPMVVLPSARLMRSGEKVDGLYLWTPISRDAAEAMTDAAGSLQPFPASELAGTGPEGRPESVVHGTVRFADPVDEDEDDGFSAAWIGGAGALVLLGAGTLGLRRHRRNGRA